MLQKRPLWICCQLGARRHYADPRALHQAGQLAYLITDAWVSPGLIPPLPLQSLTRLRQRFHPELNQASIHGFTVSLIGFELAQSLQKTSAWERIIARNCWFQKHVVQRLDTLSSQISTLEEPPTVFAYSYAALEIFRYAKSKGWRTILGQIDPGLVEEDIVRQEHIKHPEYQSTWQPAPSSYWETWREECSVSDRIVVSSVWSSQALQQLGIPPDKLDIIPLAYDPCKQAQDFERTYPPTFSAERPMRVLFLGQIILRKGIAALLEAAELLRGQPVEFWLVGSQGVARPKQYEMQEQVRWIGSVPRGTTAQYYQQADVFLFPTLSDGFGITQLEAQSWKLPLITSRFCGEVVKDKVNGLVLSEVTGEAIANALLLCLNNPRQLAAFAEQSTDISHFSLLPLQHYFQSLL
jgi:glycosyltransferase involved in cell wall biosynthesis